MARTDDENIVYSDERKKGVIDRVIATLSGSFSGRYTRIGNKYKKIAKLLDSLTKIKNEMNGDFKELILQMFDDTDKVYTRVIKTAQLTITLSKESPKSTKEELNTEEYIAALEKLLTISMAELEQIKKACTHTMQIAAKSPGLRVEIDDDINDNNIMAKLEQYISLVSRKINAELKLYDQALDHLTHKIEIMGL